MSLLWGWYHSILLMYIHHMVISGCSKLCFSTNRCSIRRWLTSKCDWVWASTKGIVCVSTSDVCSECVCPVRNWIEKKHSNKNVVKRLANSVHQRCNDRLYSQRNCKDLKRSELMKVPWILWRYLELHCIQNCWVYLRLNIVNSL